MSFEEPLCQATVGSKMQCEEPLVDAGIVDAYKTAIVSSPVSDVSCFILVGEVESRRTRYIE